VCVCVCLSLSAVFIQADQTLARGGVAHTGVKISYASNLPQQLGIKKEDLEQSKRVAVQKKPFVPAGTVLSDGSVVAPGMRFD
jgi:hypothetical protein